MPQPDSYAHKWHVMAAVGMGIFLATIDGSIVNVALPTLRAELATDFATVQWVPLAYLLTLSTLLLGMGRLGDIAGKKPIYVSGFVLFTLSSMLCGLAPSIGWLIAFRVLQAIGAAMTQALGMAIITESFPPSERGTALGVSGTLVSVGIVLGPTLGGLLIDALSWHWIFFVNLPVGIAGTLLTLRYVPRKQPRGGQRFDFAGALLLFAGLLALLLGLTLGQQRGFGDRPVWLLLGTAVLLLAGFIALEKHIRQPMVDLSLFRNQLFSINLLTGLIAFIAVAGVFILLPFYLETMLGYGPRQVGLLIAVVPVLLGVAAPISGALSDRYGTRLIATIGLGVLVGGYLAMSRFTAETTLPVYVLAVLPFGAGMGIFQSPNNSAVMGAVPHDKLGTASGLLAITRNLGQT
ncbi:MAG: DHA2 family efflux MFS transporter permease subunit, partial [Anaerolineales bacterium]|nr:DHA2 family efflux MFS transporter permease subunit [Anaerolineales bacterium]